MCSLAILAAPSTSVPEVLRFELDPLNRTRLNWTRRRVLGSLSRSALVLPFADVLAMALPPEARAQQQTPAAQHEYQTKPVAPPPGPASPIAGTQLGICYIDVAQMSCLNAKTIYGGVV
ncbi:MAG: enediyne biosynthesis protein [Acidobacteriaceae bacterium]|nr:enediyne biosynthesis protein [Acidobacteriaceae bacterium]